MLSKILIVSFSTCFKQFIFKVRSIYDVAFENTGNYNDYKNIENQTTVYNVYSITNLFSMRKKIFQTTIS